MVNRKERFATEGIRFQRTNPDGTIPTPQRFIGFANGVDLTKFQNNAALTIKVDVKKSETKTISFANVLDVSNVTVNEAVTALNLAGFADVLFSTDQKTGRLKGAYGAGTFANLTISFENDSGEVQTIPAGTHLLMIGNIPFNCLVSKAVTIEDGNAADLTFNSSLIGNVPDLPEIEDEIDIVKFSSFPDSLTANVTEAVNGKDKITGIRKIQIVGKLAAALDFGQGIKHGGNGLEIISFFDDETISIGLPKDIKDKEEIDQEGAKGTITRMIIGAMIQGISPVVTLKEKDYYLLEMIQGGKLDRENGTYNPPLSNESESPTFYAEMYSAVYGSGSNKMSDIAGYEEILFRSMIGKEGDVPVEAKSWATYAFNLTATEYTDENDETFPAWQERSMTMEQFDALKVKEFRI